MKICDVLFWRCGGDFLGGLGNFDVEIGVTNAGGGTDQTPIGKDANE